MLDNDGPQKAHKRSSEDIFTTRTHTHKLNYSFIMHSPLSLDRIG